MSVWADVVGQDRVVEELRGAARAARAIAADDHGEAPRAVAADVHGA